MVMHRTVNTDDKGSNPFLPASRNERSGRIATHKTVWEKDPTDKTQYMGCQFSSKTLPRHGRVTSAILVRPAMNNIFREIKYAYQRVVRGYDERILWGFDSYLEQIIPAIKEFCKKETSIFFQVLKYESSRDQNQFKALG